MPLDYRRGELKGFIGVEGKNRKCKEINENGSTEIQDKKADRKSG